MKIAQLSHQFSLSHSLSAKFKNTDFVSFDHHGVKMGIKVTKYLTRKVKLNMLQFNKAKNAVDFTQDDDSENININNLNKKIQTKGKQM